MTTKKQSQFSATMIGLHPEADRNARAKEVFANEARETSDYLRGVHHSRKIGHQQVNYSDTVSKLGKFQREVPVYTTKVAETQTQGANGFSNTGTEYKLTEFNEKMSQYISKEKDMNDRKRLYNRETGRVAVLNDVLAGTGPMPKTYLFPQKATHTQILALTGTLKAPDANIVPPRVERGKKWLGDGVGWDS
mmetsp:Transcript_23045/g.38590  ORF Transcript_23045/g.38590 Transcript_23045/m.38590 type:complete len:192 (+) Transcript_23045:133-708(+)